jgi:hypothetical protein
MRRDSDLAGFVHGAEVVESSHLSNIVHSATLWPPAQAPPPTVKRTVVGLSLYFELSPNSGGIHYRRGRGFSNRRIF